MKITIGNTEGDLIGDSHFVIQAGIELLKKYNNGGTLHILPGTYCLRNSVFLASNVDILGDENVIITKIPKFITKIKYEITTWMDEIEVEDSSGFLIGDAITFEEKYTKTIIRKNGNILKLDSELNYNQFDENCLFCNHAFSLFYAHKVSNVKISNITFDGNKPNSSFISGLYGCNMFLSNCNDFIIENNKIVNYNGDGINLSTCKNISVLNNVIANNQELGLHISSGSEQILVSKNIINSNQYGIFNCWGVKNIDISQNKVFENGVGISCGYKNADINIQENTINNNMNAIDVRKEKYCKNINVMNNTLEDNGENPSTVINMRDCKDFHIENNNFIENRKHHIIAVKSNQKGIIKNNTYIGMMTHDF